jgi:hypothetical protein
MTAIEHRELRGITIKNLVVTIMGTASIVASVMTTYFELRSDVQDIKASQQAEAKINNIRIKILEDQVALLQKQVDEIKSGNTVPGRQASKAGMPVLFSSLNTEKQQNH